MLHTKCSGALSLSAISALLDRVTSPAFGLYRHRSWVDCALLEDQERTPGFVLLNSTTNVISMLCQWPLRSSQTHCWKRFHSTDRTGCDLCWPSSKPSLMRQRDVNRDYVSRGPTSVPGRLLFIALIWCTFS
jgi:hypothetical protein